MPPAKPITSAANPRIKSAVKLRRSRDRRRSGLFLAEGPREVSRAIAAGLEVVEVYYCPDRMGAREIQSVLSGLNEIASVFTVTEPLLNMLAYRDEPEGVVAVVKQPVWALDDLQMVDDGALYLVAVGTQKPGNLGAFVRTAAAAGCRALLSCGTAVDAFNPNAIRASTCAVYTLPIIHLDDATAIGFLRGQGVRIAAATPDDARCLYETDLTGPLALVLGPEDKGLDARWLGEADVRVSIPMIGDTVDSLNASNAAAVLLYEAVRQRGKS
jgi:RNA methyltransferase, TrmH family